MNTEERVNAESAAEQLDNREPVTADMLIGQIVGLHPEVMDTLFSVGMHCIGCPSSQLESLRDAAYVHGLDPEKVLQAINQRIAEG